MEREARSQRELQALQATNNKAAKHQESVLVKLCVLVKLRGRAPRPRSASWRGVAWNASRASSIAKWNENGLKMLPRGLPNRSKIAPRWLPGGSRAPPESANGSGDLSCSFFWPLGRLSGRSWVALGLSWRLLGPPGALLGAIFVTQGPPLGPVWVSISGAFRKTRKP